MRLIQFFLVSSNNVKLVLFYFLTLCIQSRFLIKNNGVLFEDDLLQIGVKSEFKEQFGKLFNIRVRGATLLYIYHHTPHQVTTIKPCMNLVKCHLYFDFISVLFCLRSFQIILICYQLGDEKYLRKIMIHFFQIK